MNVEKRIHALITADPSTLSQIDRILSGDAQTEAPRDRRLLTMTEAAEVLGLSRQTIWRMIKEDRLPVIEVRRGRYRVPSAALTSMLQEG